MNEQNNIKSLLYRHFSETLEIRQVRPNIYQILIPYYYPDGDIYEIFVQMVSGNYIIQDFGLTLMKLSYYIDVDTDAKQELILRIVKENQIDFDEGNLFIHTDKDSLLPCLLAFIDTISKLSSLSLLTSKRIRSQFYEDLDLFLSTRFRDFGLVKDFSPSEVPFAKDYFCPYAITKTQKPICIFPIASNDRCDQVTITVQHYLLSKYHPFMIGIYENMEEISRKKSSKVTNLLDKQFSFLANNEEFISGYLIDHLN